MFMDRLINQFGALPGVRRRRVQVWAVVVLGIVLFLGLETLFPGSLFSRKSGGPIGPGITLSLFVSALICEYVDSSLGMGYGTTLTPVMLLVGFQPLQVVPCVLLSEFITGLCAALMHHRDGNVDLLRDRQARSAAISISALSAFGALLAVGIALHIPGSWLKCIIGVIIVCVGVITLFTIHHPIPYRRRRMMMIGTIAAFNKGLSGGGYGPLVTAGQVVSGLSPKKAVAITSLAESLTCLIALLAYLIVRGSIDWALAIPLTVGAMLSVPVATLTVRRLSDRLMRTCVGSATCALGLFTLIKVIL